MRRFHLVRDEDVSGVSGIGVVAEGVEFSDGKVAIRWLTGTASTVIWDNSEDAVAIHGHGGKTHIEWLDTPPPEGNWQKEIMDKLSGIPMKEWKRLLFGTPYPGYSSEATPPDEKKHTPRDLKSVIYRSVFEPSTVPESEQAVDQDAVRHSRIMLMALRHIAHYLDNGPAAYNPQAFIKAMHYLINVARDALREVGDE
jgi:hypothetical protein